MITAYRERIDESTATWSIWDGTDPMGVLHVSLFRWRLDCMSDKAREAWNSATRVGEDLRMMCNSIQCDFGAELNLVRIRICGRKYV